MFRFFTTAKWAIWAWLGSIVILSSLWVQVQIDVRINEWFGEFYDMVQKALGEPNAVTMGEYVGGLLSFGKLAAMAITLGLATSFLTSHFLFRWRTAMVEWYHEVYDKARTIEGAAQRGPATTGPGSCSDDAPTSAARVTSLLKVMSELVSDLQPARVWVYEIES